MSARDPAEAEELAQISIATGSLLHDLGGDVWSRHADGPERDFAADAAIRAEIERESHGEYDQDGTWRPSTWRPA